MNNTYEEELPEDDGIKLLDLLQTLAENARLLVFGPLIAGLLALGVSFTFEPIYVAETKFMIPPQQSGGAAAALAQLGALAGAASAVTGLKNPADLYIGLLKSRTLLDQMVDRFEMMKISNVKTREGARGILTKITGGSVGKDGLIMLNVTTRDPKLSASVANAYVEELSILTGRMAVTQAQRRRLFFENELAKVKEKLIQAEIALGGTGIGENVLKFNPATMGEGVATLKAQVMAKEIQLSSMRGYLTENNPTFHQTQQELSALRGQLSKFEHPKPTGGNAEYIHRYRDFKYSEVLFEQIAKQYELAKIDESTEGPLIQVVDVAVPPEHKVNKSKAIIAILSSLATGFILLIFVFVRSAFRSSLQNPEDKAKLATIRAGFGRILKPWQRANASG